MSVGHETTITRGFLFADLRGYTDFVEQRGAAAAAALLTQYRSLAREAIAQFGGAEIKTEGDSFYVVFDSVSSAVRCGLAITTAASAETDQPIRVGVGIHAGETIEADGGYVGSPVNIAARICAQAGPGEVLVSETVRALTTTVLPVRFKSRGRRHGVKLALKAHDTGGDADVGEDPARGATAATEMVDDSRTIAAVGPFTSPVAASTIPITNRAGLLECSPSTTYGGLTEPERGALEFRAANPNRINYVRLSPVDDVQSRALAAFITHDLDAESALVIVDPDWQDDATNFVKAFTTLGGQVAQAKLKPGTSPAAALGQLDDASAPDVVVFAGDTYSGAAEVRRAMREAGHESTPFVSWDGILNGSGADDGSYLQRTGKDAVGTYVGLASIPPPRADFVDAYRAAFGEEPTGEWAAAAYACAQVIVAALEAASEDGADAEGLREAVRAHAVDTSKRYETAIGTVGFDANGDSIKQMVSFFRVDTEAADGAGNWALIKQQDFGPQP